MRIAGINFPPDLLSALRNSQLVIFAGAGVSKGEPASLFDFKQLATTIAHGTGKTLNDGEPEDRFLGKLQQNNVDVHTRAAEILQVNSLGATPVPNSLHTDLLRLYNPSSSVRLVTTNFDLLFEDASRHEFTSPPETFRAPALPLGDDFNGIVHVHGTIDRPKSMVLTDADFGRAYLTEGWARRFLLQLFGSFPVLFVGYRHQDTVMHYLSRALPAGGTSPRFALVKDEDTETDHWTNLGIRPVPYPKLPGDNHSRLYQGIHALADHASLGVLGWQQRIVSLARQSPPLDEEDADLVDEALKNSTRTRFFTRAATDPQWIDWLDDRGHLNALFGNAELSGQHMELAVWLADTFARTHPRNLFPLIARHNTRLHPKFWSRLTRSTGSKEDPPLPENVLSQWASLLLITATPHLDEPGLCRLAARCAEQELFHHVVEILDALIAPQVTLIQRTSWPGAEESHPLPRVEMQLALASSSEHSVRRLWREVIFPSLDRLAERLLPRVTIRLQTRHRSHLDWKQADSKRDSESWPRHAIEPHEQDEYPRLADVLIDAARDCLEYLATHRPQVVATWCQEFAKSDVPLLRRLTVHATFVRPDLSSDEKCGWLLDRTDIHDPAAHHEMFRIFHRIYPGLGDANRRALIQAIRAYEYPGDRHKQRYTAGHRYDWFEWLLRADADCPLMAQALERIQAQDPQLQPREHPDLTHYLGRVVRIDNETPWTVEKLLSRPAERWVEDLLTFRPTDRLGPQRSRLLLAVKEAATGEFDWGAGLSDALIDGAQWESDLWSALLRGWSKSELNDEQRRRLLRTLRATELRDAQASPIAAFLCDSHEPSSSIEVNESLDPASELAADMWNRLGDTAPEGNESHDWLTRAINHPAGNLAQFWVYSLWLSRKSQDTPPTALDEPVRTALSGILQDDTVLGTLGRTVLCRSFAFLLEVDEAWTQDNLLPLFDADAGHPDSIVAWCGFLYGNTTIPAIDAMKPRFLAATPRLATDFREHGLTERFVEAITYVIFFHIDDPLREWIPRLLLHTDNDGRRTVAWHIRQNLRQIDDAQRTACWERWLKRYWERRLNRIPQPLCAEEIDIMLKWLPLLEAEFAQATDIAIQMQRVPLRHGIVLDDVIEANLHGTYPEPVAKLLDYLRHCQVSRSAWRRATAAINELIRSDIPDHLKTSLQEIVVEYELE